jgi:beta-lactamase regulating signal transducer with metallopeptidase domain
METFNQALLTFLLNSVWQVALMTAAAWIASLLLRNNPASHRHAVWTIALLASLALPLASIRSHGANVSANHLVPPVPQLDTPAPSALVTPQAVKRYAPPRRNFEVGRLTAEALTLAWLLFLCFRISRLSVRAVRTSRLRRESELLHRSPVLDAVWQRAESAFGLHGIELRVSAAIPGPVMTGVWRKTIILSATLAEQGSDATLLTAIGHEMAHIARHDFPLSLLAELLWLPLAFHPAAWLIYREIARTRELATDELVTRLLIDPDSYARSILTIAREMSMTARPGFTLGVFDGDILEERIERLTARPRATVKRARLLLASGLSALALCVLAAGGFAISARAQSAALPELKLGVDAYNSGEFIAAQDHFQRAVNADPDNVNARLFLATGTLRVISKTPQGRLGPDKTNVYDPVIAQFDQVLIRDPLNQSAIFGLATLGGSTRSQQAHDLLMKLIVKDPGNKDAYYTAAVMDWSKVYDAVQTAAPQAGPPMNAQRIPDPALRGALRSQYQPYIEEGYKLLQLGLNIDPADDHAMAYMNLLYRLDAKIADTQEQSDALTAKGDDLVKLALQTIKAKGPRPVAPRLLSVDAVPDFAGPFVPPPPPPPPPPPSRN